MLFTAALCCAEARDALCRNGVFTLGIFQYLEGMNSQRTSMGCCLCLCTPAPPQFLKEPHPLSPDQTLKSDLGFKFRGGDNPSFSVALCSEQTESVGASHTLDWQMRKLLMSNVVSAHCISCISTKLDFCFNPVGLCIFILGPLQPHCDAQLSIYYHPRVENT